MIIRNGGVLLLAVLLLVGCAASAEKMNGLALGMSRDDVVALMGEPDSASETDNALYLRYHLSARGLFTDEYFVRITGGSVDAYGKRGDFGLGY